MSENILEEAMRITSGDRRRDYDSATPNHKRIADLWNAYIQGRRNPTQAIQPPDVAIMMILLKIARASYTPTRDSAVDIAGYARCWAQMCNFEDEGLDEPLPGEIVEIKEAAHAAVDLDYDFSFMRPAEDE